MISFKQLLEAALKKIFGRRRRPASSPEAIRDLHEAVLDILFEHYPERCGLGAADISKRAGIYREPGVVHINDAIVTGCLSELHEQGKVVQKAQKNGRGGWRLSEKEYARRKGDA